MKRTTPPPSSPPPPPEANVELSLEEWTRQQILTTSNGRIRLILMTLLAEWEAER